MKVDHLKIAGTSYVCVVRKECARVIQSVLVGCDGDALTTEMSNRKWKLYRGKYMQTHQSHPLSSLDRVMLGGPDTTRVHRTYGMINPLVRT